MMLMPLFKPPVENNGQPRKLSEPISAKEKARRRKKGKMAKASCQRNRR
jgi:hypothetical protein